jgi:hypothetical protein
MSRGNRSYHGKSTEDYTDYNFDYMSKVDKKHYIDDNFDYMSKVEKKHYINDNFDYMSKVDKKRYIDDNFDYMSKVDKKRYDNSIDYDKRALAHQDTRDHHIVHQAQCQHDLPHRTRLSSSRSSSHSNHVGDLERRR